MRLLVLLLILFAFAATTAHAQNSFNLRFGSNFSFEGDFAVDESVDVIAGIGLLPLITIIDSLNLGASYRFSPTPSHLFARARVLYLPV